MQILGELEAVRSISADDLAASLQVSRRTVAHDVAALQADLDGVASIVSSNGRYRLLVADPRGYRVVRASLGTSDESFNDPGTRESHIVVRLFRALVPVRIESLAAAMSVGRTTVVADLARVRTLVAQVDLSIEGRPNVGLTLQGPELQQRLHVLRNHFAVAYPPSDELTRIRRLVERQVTAVGLDIANAEELTKWAMVAVDRSRNGRHIDYVPIRYSGLAATPAHAFAEKLARDLSSGFRVDVSGDDITFLSLPVAGMRAPGDENAASQFSVGDGASSLVAEVLAAVNASMDIDLAGSDFLTEFARHLEYMLNRMRYRIWIDASGVSNIRQDFPVAYQMATVASHVIEGQMGLPVEDSEVAFLAAYFQVFLETRDIQATPYLRVAVVADTGRISAELVRLQLTKILPRSTEFRVVSLSDANARDLSDVDLAVVSGGADIECNAPVLHVNRVLDRRELERQLERLQLHLPMRDRMARSGSVLAGALDEARFFALPAGTEYDDAVNYMTGHLETRGLLEAGFGERIRQREAQAGMQLDPWVGFPHMTLESQSSVMLAVGVVPRTEEEEGVRLIVLLGVPADPGRSESVLVQVYDEVLRLGARRDLLTALCQVTSYEDFYYFMENNSITEGEN